MQMHGINLEIREKINLICMYRTVSEECDIAKEIYERHEEIA